MNNGGSLSKHLRNAADMTARGLYDSARDELLASLNFNPAGEILGEIYFQLGICCLKIKDFAPAEEFLMKSADILNDCGVHDTEHITEALILLYENSGAKQRLEEYCLQVLQIDKFNINANLTLTDLYVKQREYAKAELIIKKALEFDDNDPRVLKACICIENELDKYRDAIKHSERFFKINTGIDLMVNTVVAAIRQKIGPVEESLRLYDEVYERYGEDIRFGLTNGMLAISPYDEIYSKERYLELIKFRLDYSSKLQRNFNFDNRLSFFKKLRIGYLSDDFRIHPVGYFVVPVLKHSRKCRAEFICYNLRVKEKRDFVGDFIFNNADAVMDLHGMDDDSLEQFILSDKPDILMELKSVSENNKLELYARRLAPLQISWIGFPTSSGIAAIDYIIADRRVDPYPDAQELYSEKLLYLKDTFLCHEIIINENSKESPCVKNGYITFGCFNNYIKITDRILKLWSEIVRSVKNSKIIFKASRYGDDYFVELLTERLLRFGFAAESFIIEPPERIDEYFKCYDNVDIILDTYPFNGATTTFDALLLGTPVITLAGDTHVSRVGLDLLSQVGLEDLVCRSDCEYVEKAVELSMDVDRLVYLKKNLRDITLKSKLTDADSFRIEYEYAMRKVWVDYCIKKRRGESFTSGTESKTLDMLKEELLNGADFIIKSIAEGELAEDVRDLLLDEYIDTQKHFTDLIVSNQSGFEQLDTLKRLTGFICKLKGLDNAQGSKVLEANAVFLERLM